MANKNIKIQIVLSPYLYQKLNEWSQCHGKPPSAFASYLISQQIEQNIESIKTMLQDMIDSGITPSEESDDD